jgi:hypothetical protein
MSVSYQLQDKQIIISSNKSKERAKSLVINQQSEIKVWYRIVMGCQFWCYRYCGCRRKREHQQILMGTILSELKGDVLQFSYLGMKTIKATVSTLNSINIVMQDEAQGLNEVVVTAFGIQRKKIFYLMLLSK